MKNRIFNGIDGCEALDFFYHSITYQDMSEGVSDSIAEVMNIWCRSFRRSLGRKRREKIRFKYFNEIMTTYKDIIPGFI